MANQQARDPLVERQSLVRQVESKLFSIGTPAQRESAKNLESDLKKLLSKK